MTREQECRERAAETAGQTHLFRFWDRLDAGQREHLLDQIEPLDFALIGELSAQLASAGESAALPEFEAPQVFPLARDDAREREAEEARRIGDDALRQGLVGYVLVAGGQGSRLGFDGPKGKFPVGPVTGCSLFEWHARRILAARERYGTVAPWYVMTSATNDAETRAFFEEHEYFGLGERHVHFFQQAMLPALDAEGRIVMNAVDSLFLAPNGHGGTLAALASSGLLADAKKRGVECFSYLQIDNPLARPADPLFLGLHIVEGASMSSKVVAKRDADEKVGVLGLRDGKLGCIEYSDLPSELRLAENGEGGLLFGAGNLAIHAIERRFVEELTEGGLKLPWHIAKKRMPAIDAEGNTREIEGFKFETFVFDALGYSPRSVTLEVDRALEFSAVKNAEGEDSPATTRRDLTALFAGWARAAGLPSPPTVSGTPAIEVDPCFAEDAEEFAGRIPAEPQTSQAGQLYR